MNFFGQFFLTSYQNPDQRKKHILKFFQLQNLQKFKRIKSAAYVFVLYSYRLDRKMSAHLFEVENI